MKEIVYLSAPVKDNPGFEEKIKPYVTYARTKGYLPLPPQWLFYDLCDAQHRDKILEDCVELVALVDVFWICGSIISSGMLLEIGAARKKRIPVYQCQLDHFGNFILEKYNPS